MTGSLPARHSAALNRLAAALFCYDSAVAVSLSPNLLLICEANCTGRARRPRREVTLFHAPRTESTLIMIAPPKGISLWLILVTALAAATVALMAQTSPAVTASTVWNPDAAAIKAIEETCGSADSANYVACFVRGMGAHGASPQAIAFAQELAVNGSRGLGYATDFTEGGRVAVTHVVFPARTEASDPPGQGWLLVNGSPATVNVDDLTLLPVASLESDLILQEIRRSHSKAGIYGDERTAASPAMMLRPDGGQRFPITYTLRNGCRSCEEV